MANITILPETTYSFGLDDQFGYCTIFRADTIEALEIGKTYIVEWDGISYKCVAVDASTEFPNAVAIGNLINFGGVGNNEPFALAHVSNETENVYIVSALTDNSLSHTLAIYVLEPDIVLKNYNGDNVYYSNVKKVALNNTNGETVIFSKGDVIEEPLEITLDFTGGN